MTRYERFRKYLRDIPTDVQTLNLTFPQVEAILGGRLPDSARRYSAWWSNSPSHPLMRVALEEGWRSDRFDLSTQTVALVRA